MGRGEHNSKAAWEKGPEPRALSLDSAIPPLQTVDPPPHTEKVGLLQAEQQFSIEKTLSFTCRKRFKCMMRMSGKVQRLSVMLPCCSCLQWGQRQASSGANYKQREAIYVNVGLEAA